MSSGPDFDPATQALIQRLKHPDPQARISAVRALAMAGNPAVGRALVQSLGDPNSHVAQAAADALGQLGRPEAVASLLWALGSADRGLRRAAIRSLARLDQIAPNLNLSAIVATGGELERLAACGDDRVVNPLGRALLDQAHHGSIRARLADALGRMGQPRAITPLGQALQSPEPEVREQVVRALGRLKARQGAPTLRQILEDPRQDPRVRAAVCLALGDMEDVDSAELLVRCLRDRDARVRGMAADGLGRMKGTAGVEALTIALRDSHPVVRRLAARSLGDLRDPRAVEPLRRCVDSPGESPEVIKEAQASLRRIGPVSRASRPPERRPEAGPSPVPDPVATLLERAAADFKARRINWQQFQRIKAQLLSRGASQIVPPNRGGSHEDADGGEYLGAYRLLRLLGKGGMGVVYAGRHRSEAFAENMGGDVALKVMHDHIARMPNYRARFDREAEVGLLLDHPGIVRVHNQIMDRGRLALVMEFVQGKPLSDLLKEASGPLPIEQASHLVQLILKPMAYSHNKGVLHRDLKPENAMLVEDDLVKILDFGLAKLIGEQAANTRRKTKVGAAMGTPEYAPPEQFIDASDVTERADIYAIGMTLYELVVGGLPWGREMTNDQIRNQKLRGELPSPKEFRPDLPAPLVALIERATDLVPERRFGSCEEMLEALVVI